MIKLKKLENAKGDGWCRIILEPAQKERLKERKVGYSVSCLVLCGPRGLKANIYLQ